MFLLAFIFLTLNVKERRIEKSFDKNEPIRFTMFVNNESACYFMPRA